MNGITMPRRPSPASLGSNYLRHLSQDDTSAVKHVYVPGGMDDNSHTTQRSEAQEAHFPSAHPRRVRKYVAPLTTF